MALTVNGLTVPTFEEVLDVIVLNEQENVSSQIDVSDNTSLGQTNQIMAAQLALAYELIQDIYDQRSIFNAEGKALDDNVSWLGVFRQGAAATAGEQYFVGTDGAIIAAGSLVQNDSTKENYNVDSATSISKSACRACTFDVIAVLDITLYTVTIQGAPYEFTSDASATATEIIAGLVAAVTTSTVNIDSILDNTTYRVTIDGVDYDFLSDGTATDDEITAGLQSLIQAGFGVSGVNAVDNFDGTLTLSTPVATDIVTKEIIPDPLLMSLNNNLFGINYTAVDNLDDTSTVSVLDSTDISVAFDINLQPNSVTSAGNITGVNIGALSAPANTVINILSPAGGWTSTFNPVELIIGREIETDFELRTRAIAFQATGGTATVDSITAELLNVSGVSSVAVNEQFVSEGVADSTITIDTLTALLDYDVTINNTLYQFTADASPTNDEITAGLTALINVDPCLLYEAIDNMDGTITIDAHNLKSIDITLTPEMSLIEGQPAGSIQIVIAGGLDDDEIAQSIWDTKPAGVEVWALLGSTFNQGTAVDFNGDNQTMDFNRPTSVNMTTVVTYKVFDEDIFPSTDAEANTAITASIVAFGNALNAGEDVTPANFEGAVYNAVGGLTDVEVVINGISSDTTTSIPIASDEEAFFSDALTSVTNIT